MKKISVLAVIGLVITICTTFLPVYVTKDVAYNYVYVDGQLGDGVIIISCAILASFFIFKKRYKRSLMFEGISLFLISYFFVNYVSIGAITNIGYGFYILSFGVVLSFASTIILFIKEKEEAKRALNADEIIVKDAFTGNVDTKKINKEITCPKCNTKIKKTHLYCPICNNRL